MTCAGGGPAAEIGRVQGGVGGNPLDGAHQPRGGLLAQMLEHHCPGPEGGDRVGDALAGDVERRAVDRLEHRGRGALGVEVGGGCDPKRARQCGGEIGRMSACRLVATIVSSVWGLSAIRMVIASTSILSQVTSGNSCATSAAISSHITMP